MHILLGQLAEGLQFSRDVGTDVPRFLARHGAPQTAEHCQRVAAVARRLALRFDEAPDQAELAGWLHDISAVIPVSQRLAAAQALGLEVLPEEAAFPMILHQKLSIEIARELFKVTRPAVLNAIGCHTTLKADASRLDMVVFIADKLEWDGSGTAPFLPAVLAGLERSLEHGVFAYLNFLWQQRDTLRCVHPWLAAAYRQLAPVLSV